MRLTPSVRFIASAALAMLLVSCATSSRLEEHKTIAYSAGFKVIHPVKPDQVAILSSLPKDKVTPINYQGKTYYILPDAENNQAFVGGKMEFTTYQHLCMKKLREEERAAEQMDQAAAFHQMNWGAWGGWPMGYGRVIHYR
ncbi:hypothetical protein [Verrucomicrobium sp. BvORR106]|uniref:hypothetical protein n=1 Tax=Verrucomicrobium sp. BvORR106 TaxID=1403819 RepID=UPI002240F6D0|nr:hypothetical protein [Verrucomicrobium sp. BvORR106]